MGSIGYIVHTGNIPPIIRDMLISPSDICWSTSFSFREIFDKAHVDTYPWGHAGLDSSAFEKYLIWIVIRIVFQYVDP